MRKDECGGECKKRHEKGGIYWRRGRFLLNDKKKR